MIGALAPDQTGVSSPASAGGVLPSAAPALPNQTLPAPPPVPVPAAAITAATRWATAFLYHPGQTTQAWLDRLQPLTTPEYLGLLGSDGNAAAAPRHLVGAATGISAAAGSALVDVPTDQQTLRLELVDNGSAGWQVSAADTAPTGAGPGNTLTPATQPPAPTDAVTGSGS